MNIKRTIVWIVVWLMTVAAWGTPRSEQQMRSAAVRALANVDAGAAGSAKRVGRQVRTLQENVGLVVMGYADGGFAVIAKDDVFPAVLGYSSTVFDPDTRNSNFKWWLQAMEEVTRRMPQTLKLRLSPADYGFAPRVKPLVKTSWGQSYPFNMYCPTGTPSGCVATATAQVLKYFEWPKEGHGEVFTYMPFGDYEGIRLEATLGDQYRYELMSDFYDRNSTKEQEEEVGKLMYHVGLAMRASYDYGGTGAYSETLAYGLRHHLDYPFAVVLAADDYTAEEWNQMVYRQIHEGIPVIYGGSDSDYSGHEFVLDGYDEEGAVHINWGWNGAEDGYFDLQTLTLYSFYDFSYYQDMLIRCTPHRLSTETVDVDVQVPGTLHRLLSEEQLSKTMSLRVSGRINSTDLKTLRAMAGRSNAGTGTWGQLSFLDLSEARLVAGGEPYLIEDTKEYRIEDDDVMPYKAFAGCALLIDVTLPRCLRGFGDGVFANCHNLDHVAVTVGEESDFVVEGSFVLNRDRSELIACLPGNGCDTEYAVPDGVRVIHDYAFAGLFLYDRLVLPATVEKIGRYAFNRCFDLMRTYVYATEPPEIDPTAIDDLDLSLRSLYVPAQSKRHYQKAPGWKKYKSSVWSIDDNGIVATPTHEYPAVSTVYDLWGRMMDKRPLPPGIYLRSGKKYIVR